MNQIDWYFPTTAGGQIDGFNDAAREHFEGIHEHFLAREIIQNSLDARISKESPVEVVFEMKKYPPSSVPGIDNLKYYFEKARNFSAGQEGASEFYDHALQLLTSSSLMLLRIGDYNTKGLTGGDDDQNDNWARLIIMEGASSKKGAGGGSFGIGKNASYVASSLRTVYYSTLTEKGDRAFQGKSKISSFKDNDDMKQGTGMFGITTDRPSSIAVRDEDDIPSEFSRDKQGTDVIIAGYEPTHENEPWRFRLIESILQNFWAAIHFKDLVVTFRDEDSIEEINSSNIGEYLSNFENTEDGSLPYYQALTETEPILEELNHLGSVRLYVKKNENYPRKIQLMRSPKMVVKTKRVHTLHENYAAVFICDNEKGNNILRAIEPPAHNDWDPERKSGQYRPAITEMNNFLRENLRKLNPYNNDEPEDIPDLGKYLSDIEERDDLMEQSKGLGDDTDTTSEEESPREVGSEEKMKISKPKLPQTQDLTVVDSPSGGKKLKPKENEGHGGGKGGGGGGDGDTTVPAIDTSSFSFRSFATKGKDGATEYIIMLHPSKDTRGYITILAIGEDSDYPVMIDSAIDEDGNKLDISESDIKGLVLKKNIRKKISIRLQSNRRYALGVQSREY